MARPDPTSRRPLAWLAGGAALGVTLAALGLLAGTGSARLAPGVVASVNGTPIATQDYQRVLAGVESDTRQSLTPEIKQRVLDRMIDEELLVQRGLELGLAQSDRRVRGDLSSAVIRSVVVESEDREPSEEQMRRFYEEEKAFFSQPGRVRVVQVFVRVRGAAEEEAARARARQAWQRLSDGEPFDSVRRELGDPEVSPIPATLLPPTKLREYVGPTAMRAVLKLEVGQISEPVRSGIGYHVFWLVDREQPRTPPFEEIRDQVRAEWIRRAGDRALRSYLDELRDRAEVRIREELP